MHLAAGHRPTALSARLERQHLALLEQLESRGWGAASWAGGYTLLHWAGSCGEDDLCRYLCHLRADPGASDARGLTPVEYARDGGHTAIARLLQQFSRGTEQRSAPSQPSLFTPFGRKETLARDSADDLSGVPMRASSLGVHQPMQPRVAPAIGHGSAVERHQQRTMSNSSGRPRDVGKGGRYGDSDGPGSAAGAPSSSRSGARTSNLSAASSPRGRATAGSRSSSPRAPRGSSASPPRARQPSPAADAGCLRSEQSWAMHDDMSPIRPRGGGAGSIGPITVAQPILPPTQAPRRRSAAVPAAPVAVRGNVPTRADPYGSGPETFDLH